MVLIYRYVIAVGFLFIICLNCEAGRRIDLRSKFQDAVNRAKTRANEAKMKARLRQNRVLRQATNSGEISGGGDELTLGAPSKTVDEGQFLINYWPFRSSNEDIVRMTENEGLREAEPHHHHHHSHVHIKQHVNGGVDGFLPVAPHVVVPEVNVNVFPSLHHSDGWQHTHQHAGASVATHGFTSVHPHQQVFHQFSSSSSHISRGADDGGGDTDFVGAPRQDETHFALENPADHLVSDSELERNFSPNPVFDPFHEREAVMDFLDQHQFRQTPFEFNGNPVFPLVAEPAPSHKVVIKKYKKPKFSESEPDLDLENQQFNEPRTIVSQEPPQDGIENFRQTTLESHDNQFVPMLAEPAPSHKLKMKKRKKPKFSESESKFDFENQQFHQLPPIVSQEPFQGEIGTSPQQFWQSSPDFADNSFGRMLNEPSSTHQRLPLSASEPEFHLEGEQPHELRQDEAGNSDDSIVKGLYLFQFPRQGHIELDRDSSGTRRKRSTPPLETNTKKPLKKSKEVAEAKLKYARRSRSKNRIATTGNSDNKNNSKRAVPLTRLLSDPNTRLDIPRTVKNFGAVAKTAFEDEQAPMYHLKNLIGSSRNTLLSAMRIPPQNMVIPSDYEIVRTNDGEIVGDINPKFQRVKGTGDIDDDFYQTFQKVGQAVRDSIKSSQDTVSHIEDMAHDARSIIHTARNSAPRIIAPYSQIPALQKQRKVVLITPRIIEVDENHLSKPSKNNFVKIGNLLDATGLSSPNFEKVGLEKYVIQPRIDSNGRLMYKSQKNELDTVGEALNTLEDAKVTIGAKNLRELLRKMQRDFRRALQSTFADPPKVHKKPKVDETRVVDRFLEDLFDKKAEAPQEDVVGAGLLLPPDLYKPFMGRVSQKDLHNYFKENGFDDQRTLMAISTTTEAPLQAPLSQKDSIRHLAKHLDDETLGNFLEFLNTKQDQNHLQAIKNGNARTNDNNQDLGYVLGAINPLMFERNYNQTLIVNNSTSENPQTLFRKVHKTGSEADKNAANVGTALTVSGPILKPFMGKVQPEKLQDFFDTYSQNEDYVDFDENNSFGQTNYND